MHIVLGYLGIKRRKLGFIHRSSLENKQKVVFNRYWVHGCIKQGAWAPEGSRNAVLGVGEHGTCVGGVWGIPQMWFFAFSFVLSSENSKNLKWIFFTLYCLQQPFKKAWSSILHHWSFTWCRYIDLHDYSLQNTQNTHGVAWSRIIMNYNDSSENNTKCSSNHW